MVMEKIKRYLAAQIAPWLFKGKVIIVLGARQVGKTTVSNFLVESVENGLYVNCERSAVKGLLESMNPEKIKSFTGKSTLVVFDEAQKIHNIGSVLKLLVDTFPEIQWIATGSSSFDLSNQVNEPLTGRNVKFLMFPLWLGELESFEDRLTIHEKLESILRFGLYPDIYLRSENEKRALLEELATDYLYRDVLELQSVKNSSVLMNLLKALALQLGSEVSLRELSGLLGVSVETIQRYLNLLEQSFVILKLSPFSRNIRSELNKTQKYYFYDLGIRNSLINNFNPIALRTDQGVLWENFCILERMKMHAAKGTRLSMYFWRTYEQKEIDLVEEYDGKLHAIEFKWNPKKTAKMPKMFSEAYPNSDFKVIHPENYWEHLV
jgi:predicted AAA+ superfamily ATPase